MSRGIRIVSRFPAPECLREYEPFQLKGADLTGRKISLQTIPVIQDSEWGSVQKAMARFFVHGTDGGVWPLDMLPEIVVFSLDLACSSRGTIPGNFELFIQLCHSLDVDVYLICNQSDPVVVKVYTLDAIFYAHKVRLLPDEPTGGIQRELRDPVKRVEWLARVLQTQQRGGEKVALITDRIQDAVFSSLCPHMVSFCQGPHVLPIHAQVRSQDCAYLAYLLFGREVTAVRRHGY